MSNHRLQFFWIIGLLSCSSESVPIFSSLVVRFSDFFHFFVTSLPFSEFRSFLWCCATRPTSVTSPDFLCDRSLVNDPVRDTGIQEDTCGTLVQGFEDAVKSSNQFATFFTFFFTFFIASRSVRNRSHMLKSKRSKFSKSQTFTIWKMWSITNKLKLRHLKRRTVNVVWQFQILKRLTLFLMVTLSQVKTRSSLFLITFCQLEALSSRDVVSTTRFGQSGRSTQILKVRLSSVHYRNKILRSCRHLNDESVRRSLDTIFVNKDMSFFAATWRDTTVSTF